MARVTLVLCLLVNVMCVALSQDNDSSTTTTTIASTAAITSNTIASTTATTITTTTHATTNTDATTVINTSTATANSARKYLSTDGLPTCKQQSAEFNDCVKRILEAAILRLKEGDKELNIPSIDPFYLNRTAFRYSNGPVSGRILMRNAQVYGFSKLEFRSVDLKVNDSQIKMRLVSLVPEVHIVGNYKAEVVVNNVRLRPRGDFNITLFNVSIDQTSEGEFYAHDEHRFVRFIKFDADPKVGDFKFEASGIFPDPTLNEIAMNIINQYWRQIFRVFLPETRQYWAPMLLRVVNDAMSVVPYDQFVVA